MMLDGSDKLMESQTTDDSNVSMTSPGTSIQQILQLTPPPSAPQNVILHTEFEQQQQQEEEDMEFEQTQTQQQEEQQLQTISINSQNINQQTSPSSASASESTAAVTTTTGPIINQSSCTELEDQDIEEVLKALKGFEGNSAFEGDLNNLFNDVYTNLHCDEMDAATTTTNNQSQIPNQTQIQNPNLNTNAEPEQNSMILHRGDSNHLSSITTIQPSPIEESHMEIVELQNAMHKRIISLIKRLRKKQIIEMCRHISEEIAGVFEVAARETIQSTANDKPTNSEDADLAALRAIVQARPFASTWPDEKKTAIPIKQINGFLKRLETVAQLQQENAKLLAINAKLNANNNTPLRKSRKFNQDALVAGGGGAANGNGSATKIDSLVPLFNEDVTEEMYQVFGMLTSEVKEVQESFDSDATDSSSGAESADEMVSYNNQLQQIKPM